MFTKLQMKAELSIILRFYNEITGLLQDKTLIMDVYQKALWILTYKMLLNIKSTRISIKFNIYFLNVFHNGPINNAGHFHLKYNYWFFMG